MGHRSAGTSGNIGRAAGAKITAYYDPTQDLDVFFTEFKAALGSWLIKNSGEQAAST